jgi:LPXTG-motif cell wall-anchored protein
VNDPWCSAQPAGSPFTLAAGANKVLTCSHTNVAATDDGHVNTATVSGVTSPGGKLADQTAKATINVSTPTPPVTNKLGDYVWVDSNRNGIQDSGEPALSGIPVTLKGTKTGTATTDAGGKYLFDNLPDGTYSVCFDFSKLPAQYADYKPTKQNAAGHNGTDSAADTTGCTATTTLGASKRQDLTLDAGISGPPNQLGDFVWVDTNRNGIQDSGEPAVAGVTATLKNDQGTSLGTTTTDAGGKYLFDNLADGTYQVCFDVSTAAQYKTYQLTQANAAGHNGTDSAADQSTRCTGTTTLGVGKRQDLTLDAGLVAPTNKLGDFVWLDTNKNGLQDTGEPGVPGVTVTLKGTSYTTTTDVDGKYLFDGLPDGTYTACFDPSTAPAQYNGFSLTKPNAANHNGTDSTADTATKCAAPTTLGPDKREDLTLDAGIVSPPNKLGDFVWVDTNKNGLQDAGEPGVQGVPVTVKDSTGKVVGTATTDANGKYVVDNLNDGTYTVCFDLTKLPQQYWDYQLTKPNAANHNGTDSAADPGTSCTAPTTLGSAKRADMTLDAGIQPPVNRLGDFVWVDANHNGIQDNGEPGVQGVKVTLKGTQSATTTTDAGGKYLFDNLPDGTYSVCFDVSKLPAQYADYAVTKQNAADHNGTDSAADTTGCTTTTTLGAGHRADMTLDAGISAPPNKVGDFVWVDTNHNGIQDAGEPGLQGVTVNLTGTQTATTTTDAEGKYLFDNLPDGTYQVCVDLSKLPQQYADFIFTKQNAANHNGTDSAAGANGCTPEATVGLNHRSDLTLDAGISAPPNRLGDFVWVDSNHNGIQDNGEPGVPNVLVTLKGTTTGSTTTDAKGRYAFDNLPDGTYSVCFDVSKLPQQYGDYAVTKQNAANHNGTDSAADTTGCTATTTLGVGHRQDLTLDAGISAPPNRLGDFVWVDSNRNGVQDAGEPGVAGVAVTLKGTSYATTTDASGKYLFDNLPDGTYTVCFDVAKLPAQYVEYQVTKQNAANHNGTDSAADPASGCTRSTTLGVGHRQDLTLDAGIVAPANRLGDFVWSDTNGNGIQDPGEPGIAGVTVTLKGTSYTTTTDASGKYLFDNLPDGAYTVCFTITGKYQVTKQNAANHNGTDSAATPATACTPSTTLGAGHRQDLTMDCGVVPQASPVVPGPPPPAALAYTGTDSLGLVALAGLLLVAGGGLVLLTRRRRVNG